MLNLLQCLMGIQGRGTESDMEVLQRQYGQLGTDQLVLL